MDRRLLLQVCSILFLFLALFLVGSYALEVLKEPSGITELSFPSGTLLPDEISQGVTYPLIFEIVNHEGATETYSYEIMLNSAMFKQGIMTVDDEGRESVVTDLQINGFDAGKDVQIAILIPDHGLQIQQWVKAR